MKLEGIDMPSDSQLASTDEVMTQKLSVLLTARNITNTQLADHLGKDRSTISRWINHRATISDADLEKIIEFCDVRCTIKEFRFLGLDDFRKMIEVPFDEFVNRIAPVPSLILNTAQHEIARNRFRRECLGIYDTFHFSFSVPNSISWNVACVEDRDSYFHYERVGMVYEYVGFLYPMRDNGVTILAEEAREGHELVHFNARVITEYLDHLRVLIVGLAAGYTPNADIGCCAKVMIKRADTGDEDFTAVKQAFKEAASTLGHAERQALVSLDNIDTEATRAIRIGSVSLADKLKEALTILRDNIRGMPAIMQSEGRMILRIR